MLSMQSPQEELSFIHTSYAVHVSPSIVNEDSTESKSSHHNQPFCYAQMIYNLMCLARAAFILCLQILFITPLLLTFSNPQLH